MYISRTNNVDIAGNFFSFLSAIYIFSCFSRFGLDQLAVKYLSIAYSQNSINNVLKVLKKNYSTLTTGCILVSVFIYLITLQNFCQVNSKIGDMRSIVITLPFFSLFFFNTEILKSFNRPVLSQFLQNATIPFLFIIFHSVIYSHQSSDLYNAYMSSVIVASCILIILIKYTLTGLPKTKVKTLEVPFFSLSFFLFSISIIVFNWGGVFLLGIFSDSRHVALFNVISRVATVSYFLSTAINAVFVTKFSTLAANLSYDRLKKSLIQSLYISIPLSILFFLFVTLFSKKILAFFGPDYIVASKSMILLSLAYSINSAFGSIGLCLMMSGWERVIQKVSWFSVGLFFLLVLTLAQFELTEFTMATILLGTLSLKSIILALLAFSFFESAGIKNV